MYDISLFLAPPTSLLSDLKQNQPSLYERAQMKLKCWKITPWRRVGKNSWRKPREANQKADPVARQLSWTIRNHDWSPCSGKPFGVLAKPAVGETQPHQPKHLAVLATDASPPLPRGQTGQTCRKRNIQSKSSEGILKRSTLWRGCSPLAHLP